MTTDAAEIVETVAALSAYGRCLEENLLADAQSKAADLERTLGWSDADQDAPSLLRIMDVAVQDETRHSAMLGRMLSKRRSGVVAKRFWDQLIQVLKAESRVKLSQQQREALSAWDPRHLATMEVRPRFHRDEWQNIDVFARASDRNLGRV